VERVVQEERVVQGVDGLLGVAQKEAGVADGGGNVGVNGAFDPIRIFGVVGVVEAQLRSVSLFEKGSFRGWFWGRLFRGWYFWRVQGHLGVLLFGKFRLFWEAKEVAP